MMLVLVWERCSSQSALISSMALSRNASWAIASSSLRLAAEYALKDARVHFSSLSISWTFWAICDSAILSPLLGCVLLIDGLIEQPYLEEDLVDPRPVLPARDIMVYQPEIAVDQAGRHRLGPFFLGLVLEL